MKQKDLLNYFTVLDDKFKGLNSKSKKLQLKEEFPPYTHIGRYINPLENETREFYLNLIQNDLSEFSFDPLLSFDMNQIKYSKDILHPRCNCFRRSRSKLRPIKTSSHRDRILFACWNEYLSSKHKQWLINNNIINSVSAYVPNTGKFNANYAKTAFDYLQSKNEYSAVALDVKSFFNKISHSILRQNLIKLINEDARLSKVNYRLFKSVTNYTYIELNDLLPNLSKLDSGHGMYFSRANKNWNVIRSKKIIKTNKSFGIPQGLPCSGSLANISMMGIDVLMTTIANENDSIYLRYADDIFIAAPNDNIKSILYSKCIKELNNIDLPLAEEKTEQFSYSSKTINHPNVSYLGLVCKGSEITVRMNGVNKYYQRTKQFIYSYVLTCRQRGIEPSRSRIRAIFSHSGNNNYYSYLRRVSTVFEQDERYKTKGIKGILKGHIKWMDTIFDDALRAKPKQSKSNYLMNNLCTCPLNMDNKK